MNATLQSPASISLEQLRVANDQIALELFNTMSVPGVFKGLVTQVLDTFKFTSAFTTLEKIEPLPKDQAKFLKLVNSMPYTSLGELRAFTVEGMKESYLDFLKVLLPVSEYVMNVQSTLVTPYANFLAQFISDHKFSTSVYDDKKELEKIEKKREQIYKDFSKLYGKESYKSQVNVKNVIERNADWAKIFPELNKVIKNLESVDRADLKNQIKQCTDYIEIILKDFDNRTDRKVSQEAAHRLSNHAYTIGKELELFSTTYYRALALRGAIENTMESIKDALE